ncbi:MAG TPA: dihydrolipoamide acetyltransferase family protein [Armatimonadota bacterium]|nr:dihydrolipoamide acetyltransferase family protein [Armatimonadota bacterium]HPO72251.1 dihydrolipoamide acetyltransferase family protein [Armatimonadota bacterium]
MATKVIMPKMGYDMEEGKIVRWLKDEGAPVHRGEDIAEIETEKVNIAIQAYGDGVLRKHVAKEGETVPVGALIAVIGDPDEPIDLEALRKETGEEGEITEDTVGAGEGREAVPEVASAGAQALAVSGGTPEAPMPKEEAAAAAAPQERLKVSPLASRLAAERGIDLRQVQGTGPGGRITRDDVLHFAEQAAAPKPAAPEKRPVQPAAQVTPEGLAPMRQAIARRMAQSKREAPHFYVTIAIEMNEALKLRDTINSVADDASRVSVNDLVVKAVAGALATHREFNARLVEDRLTQEEAINIGIAIALPDGLVAPALMHCEEKSLTQIARASKDLIARAKSGGLRPEELTEATFSTSNMGMFDVESFSAIIVPPQVAILAIASVQETPVVRNGQVTVAQIMKVTLSADHRAVDGAQAALFLQEVRKRLENPALLLV